MTRQGARQQQTSNSRKNQGGVFDKDGVRIVFERRQDFDGEARFFESLDVRGVLSADCLERRGRAALSAQTVDYAAPGSTDERVREVEYHALMIFHFTGDLSARTDVPYCPFGGVNGAIDMTH